MRTTLLLFTLFTLGYLSANAQYEDANFGFGIKAGLYDGKTLVINTSNSISQVGLPSYSAGIFGNIKLKNSLSIQAELLYTRMAFTGSYLNGYNPDWDETLNFIDLPAFAKYTVKNTGFSILVGLNFGFLQSAKYKPSGANEMDDMAYYKKLDIGPALGFDYKFRSGVVLSLRKTLGVLNLAKNRSDNTIELPSGTYITVGYQF